MKTFNLIRLFLFSLLLLVFSGCEKENNTKTLVDLVEHFKASGIKIDSYAPCIYQIIRASDGLALTIDGSPVEIYKYDKRINDQKEKIERIEKDGDIYILAVKFPVRINGSFILLNYKNHPKEAQIIEAFNSF